ncbi:hypothetical protein Pen02_63910 [Plantactinospora endophytica]|uniref:Uncharacterized protein n=1 Tax=Plantactinospora endophytica TaxID=673535 RepID=A0ABQ4E9P4_9ACTN|nr:hypothetical protein Pen02_63910 [Plantactinospora endophytica]
MHDHRQRTPRPGPGEDVERRTGAVRGGRHRERGAEVGEGLGQSVLLAGDGQVAYAVPGRQTQRDLPGPGSGDQHRRVRRERGDAVGGGPRQARHVEASGADGQARFAAVPGERRRDRCRAGVVGVEYDDPAVGRSGAGGGHGVHRSGRGLGQFSGQHRDRATGQHDHRAGGFGEPLFQQTGSPPDGRAHPGRVGPRCEIEDGVVSGRLPGRVRADRGRIGRVGPTRSPPRSSGCSVRGDRGWVDRVRGDRGPADRGRAGRVRGDRDRIGRGPGQAEQRVRAAVHAEQARGRTAQPVPGDLPGGGARDLGHRVQRDRHLVVGQPRAQGREGRRHVERLRRVEHEVTDRLLAEHLVGLPGRCGIGHAAEPTQHLVDLAGMDVLPASDDQVLDPATDRQVPGGVAAGQVTGAVPAVA